jgi:GDP-mannose 6-dehydrogenase
VSDPQVQAVSVFGLGYVGCVSAACLASRGHRVVGVDVNPDKVESLQQGRSPVVEEKIGDLTAEVVAAGDLTVTTDARASGPTRLPAIRQILTRS